MSETVNERISVSLFSNHLKGSAFPSRLWWRGRQYQVTKVGLHHLEREGRTLFHVFSVTDGTTFFRLRLDTETLRWRLVEVEMGG